jgi:acyl-CoA dehydrogenase
MKLSDGLERARRAYPVLKRHAADVDRSDRFASESVSAVRDEGLMGLLVPAEFGGLGGDLDDLVLIAQCLAGGCLSTAMIWAMHCQQVDTLVRFGSPALCDRLLPRIASGSLYIASVTSERGKGGHLLTANAPLGEDPGCLDIERDAPVVTGGLHADGYLITMRAGRSAKDNEVSLVYAGRDQVEVRPEGDWNALGMRGTSSGALRIAGRVPSDQVVGEPGKFPVVAVESYIPCGHLAWAACWLGAARAALSEFLTVLHSPQRPTTLQSSSDLVAERIARVRTALELVSAYLARTTEEVMERRRLDKSMDDPAVQIHLNVLKVAASELTLQAISQLVGLGGLSLGYLKDSPVPLERYLRDLQSAPLNYGNDRLLVATGLLSRTDRSVRLI